MIVVLLMAVVPLMETVELPQHCCLLCCNIYMMGAVNLGSQPT